MPTYDLEQAAHQKGYMRVAGVDEVGRGPWAGPVVAAAVVLDPERIPAGLNDSKKLSPKKRAMLAQEVCACAVVGFGEASVEEIDRLNIREATFLAMTRALEALPNGADYALIDGNVVPPKLGVEGACVVKGDAHVLSIAAASIVAKVRRDTHMAKLGEIFPHYDWASNAGYGTKAHQEGLAQHGVCEHHRRSFAPIKRLVEGHV